MNIAVGIGLGLLGYSTYRKYQAAMKLTYDFVDMSRFRFNGTALTFQIRFRVNNPTPIPLRATRFVGHVFMNGQDLGYFNAQANYVNKGLESTVVSAQCAGNIAAFARQTGPAIVDLLNGKRRDVRIVGTVITYGFAVPLDFSYSLAASDYIPFDINLLSQFKK